MSYFLCVCINIGKCRVHMLRRWLKPVQVSSAYELGSLLLKKFVGRTVIKERKPKPKHIKIEIKRKVPNL